MGKYDITSGLTEYKSQAFDPGIENFREVAKLYRETYDKNSEATNLMYKAINQMDLAEGDEELRTAFRDNINSNLGNVLETGDYLNASEGVNNAYRYLTSDMTVIQAQKNAAERAKDKAFIAQYGESGVIDFNDGIGSTFKTLNEDGSLNTYTSKMEVRANYDAKMQELIGNIASGTTGDIMQYGDVNGDQIMDYLKYGTAEGVSQQKMERVVEGLINNYLGSSEGQQDYRRLTQTGQRVTDLGAKQDIRRRFRAIGQTQVGITQNVQLKMTPQGSFGASGGGGGAGGAGISNVAEAMTKGEYFLGQQGMKTLFGSEEGSTPGSVAYTTGKDSPLILNYANIFDQDDKDAIIGQDVVRNGIQNNGMTNDADVLLNASLMAMNMEKQGAPSSDAQAFFYQATGFRGTQDEYQNVVNSIVQGTRQTKLGNMGALLTNLSITGEFVPQGNAQVIGTSHITQRGTMYVTEDQLNQMALQADLGQVGSFNLDGRFMPRLFTKDINKIRDAQGNLIFREAGKDENDNQLYAFDMYTSPLNMTGGGAGSNMERLDMTESDYTDNEGALKMQVRNQAYISAQTNDMLNRSAQTGISNTEANVLSRLFITQPQLVNVYAKDPNAFILRYDNALKSGKSTIDFGRSELGLTTQ